MPFRFPRRERGRPRHPGLFTPAEERVHGLLREGLTNAEIAARTGLSINTVHSHVASMLAKSGAANRQELARVRSESRPPRAPLALLPILPRILAWGAAGVAVVGGTVILVAAFAGASGRGEDPPAAAPPSSTPATTPAPTATPNTLPDARALFASAIGLPYPPPAGPSCLTGPVRRVDPTFGDAVGPGPVYAVGWMQASGAPWFAVNGQLPTGIPAGWAQAKTILAVEPGHSGPLSLRGMRLDGSGEVLFDIAGYVQSQPTIDLSSGPNSPPPQPGSWTSVVISTFISEPGCYAVQLDSPDIQEVIVFEAAFCDARGVYATGPYPRCGP